MGGRNADPEEKHDPVKDGQTGKAQTRKRRLTATGRLEKVYMAAPQRKRRCVERNSMVKRGRGGCPVAVGLTGRPSPSGRSGHRGLPAAHVASVRRLPSFPSSHNSAFNALVFASPSAAARYPKAAGVEGDKPEKKKFKAYLIGCFHIDIAGVQTAEGKLCLYAAIDRTSKFAFVQLVKKTGRTSASVFPVALIEAVPYKIHTVLTDNGIQFTVPPRYADGPTARCMTTCSTCAAGRMALSTG